MAKENVNSPTRSSGHRSGATTGPGQRSRPANSNCDQSVLPPDARDHCRSLISEVLGDENLRERVCRVPRDDALLVANYLDIVCREADIAKSSEPRRAFALLCKLAEAAVVFPSRYKLTEVTDGRELIGRGGFADVYKGKYKGHPVCLKIFHSFLQRRKGKKSMHAIYARELTLWAHLCHKNILPFYGVCLLQGEPCLVSPWMEKGNILEYLKKSPDTPRMHFISDILEGLSYLHDLHIVHSDLKAENVLVSNDDRALITDFGLSSIAATSKLAFVTQYGGTYHWMAPELRTASHKVRATKFCDIWSFACLIYEILTTKVPFYQYDEHQLLAALNREEIPLRILPGVGASFEGIDDEMWELLKSCWSYKAEERPSCKEIRNSLVAMGIRDVEPPIAGDVTTSSPPMRGGPYVVVNYERVREVLLQSTAPVNPSAVQVNDAFRTPKDGTTTGECQLLEMWSPKFEQKEIQGVETEELSETDTVIALMGPSGSGKSSFITSIAGVDRGVGHSLESCTDKVTLTRVKVPAGDKSVEVVLVDTPGLDDTRKTGLEVLQLICEWLEQVGHKGVRLDGILYLHRITDNRMAGTPLRCFEVFEKICGPQACGRVTVVTTMWDTLEDEEVGWRREEELTAGPWASMIRRGSSTGRYGYTEKSAWQILEPFVDSPKTNLEPVQLQRETITHSRSLPHTDAGQELYHQLSELHKNQYGDLRMLRKQMEKPGADESVATSLQEEYRVLEQEHQERKEELRQLQVPVLQRFFKSLSVMVRYR